MKKIINSTESVVREMCNGIVLAHPELELLEKYKVIKKRHIDLNKVTLISGGGSGHEPAHAGYVGKGMLDAAVCGDVFASPSQIQVYQAIKQTASNAGTLLIIKNYSGDMMNFRNAAYLAQEDGLIVDYVKVDDDIAVKDSLYTSGRRGVAGTVLVHKITGAAAERGLSLPEVKAVAEKAIRNVKSIGFALTSCTVPAKGTPTFEIAEDEMEYGVGIHGEPGIQRRKVATANELAKVMVSSLIDELDLDETHHEVALLINGFGSTPLQELYLLNNAVSRELFKRRISIRRTLVGNYMTSIDMAGASITILKLDNELNDLLSDTCDTPALKISGDVPAVFIEETSSIPVLKEDTGDIETDRSFSLLGKYEISLNNLIYMLDLMSNCIIRNEVRFCELDAHAGDGDFGMSLAKGFKKLKSEWREILAKSDNIGGLLDACSMVIMEHCGGASGPIWGSAFRAAGKYANGKTKLTVSEFSGLVEAAVKGIQLTGERSFGRGAVVGDKTLIDALVPAAESLKASAENRDDAKTALVRSAEAAVKGAKSTEKFPARMGRAAMVGDRSIGYPDAGAFALGVIFTEVAQAMN